MNKLGLALLFAVLATLTLTGVAAAAAPQGHAITSAGGVNVTATLNITNITLPQAAPGISDGETVNVALKNDKSGDCDGDAGTLIVTHTGLPNTVQAIRCAHFTGSGRMAIAFLDLQLGTFVVLFIVDATPDRVYIGSTPGFSLADGTLADKWVNLGWEGSGAKAIPRPMPQATITSGDFIVTA
jgi:hypothetical protein